MKKIISFSICFALILSLSFSSADTTVTADQAGNYLKALGIYKGYEDGTLGLEKNITRAEFATLAVRILGLENQQQQKKGATVFNDIGADFWGSGYINIAVERNLVKGYPEDNTFRPQGNITYAEALTVLVRLLGYESSVEGEWPNSFINKSQELGITGDLSYAPDHVVNRGDIAILIFNSLSVPLAE